MLKVGDFACYVWPGNESSRGSLAVIKDRRELDGVLVVDVEWVMAWGSVLALTPHNYRVRCFEKIGELEVEK